MAETAAVVPQEVTEVAAGSPSTGAGQESAGVDSAQVSKGNQNLCTDAKERSPQTSTENKASSTPKGGSPAARDKAGQPGAENSMPGEDTAGGTQQTLAISTEGDKAAGAGAAGGETESADAETDSRAPDPQPGAVQSMIINWEEAMAQVGGDGEFLNEVLGDLLTEAIAAEEEIMTSINDNVFESVMKSAHRVKGSASYLCCERLKEASFILQQAGAAGIGCTNPESQWERIQELFHNFRRAIEEVKAEVAASGGAPTTPGDAPTTSGGGKGV